LQAEQTAGMMKEIFPGIPIEVVPDPYEAVRGVAQVREEGQAVLVFGSMYIVGPARRVCRELATAVSDFGIRV
jgi:folylpolyglutamate synthase/dihydropteroate synthase